jgi:pimeloyl-ACP methyl ester carboxylesterase
MAFLYVLIPVLFVLIGILVAWLATRRLLSLRSRTFPLWRKLTECLVLSLLALAAVVIAGSSAFNAVALYRFRHSPPGQTILVNGHAMRIDCSGSGSPVIVLDAGLGNNGLIWGRVQPALAKTTRVCSYDRAGFGWSEPLPPPRDADHIATELHELLAAAQVTGPIVLMGHSIAGIYMRDYATRYPENVAGLIFVDGSTPLQNRNPAFKAHFNPQPPSLFQALWKQAKSAAGIPRLLGECSDSLPGFDPHAAQLEAEDQCHDRSAAVAAELESFDRSGEETVHTGPYGTLPILIFSQDPVRTAKVQTMDIVAAWNQMQEDLKQLSTHSRRIIAQGSTHYVQGDRADLIESEVPKFIEQIRGTEAGPTDYGSTQTK